MAQAEQSKLLLSVHDSLQNVSIVVRLREHHLENLSGPRMMAQGVVGWHGHD